MILLGVRDQDQLERARAAADERRARLRLYARPSVHVTVLPSSAAARVHTPNAPGPGGAQHDIGNRTVGAA